MGLEGLVSLDEAFQVHLELMRLEVRIDPSSLGQLRYRRLRHLLRCQKSRMLRGYLGESRVQSRKQSPPRKVKRDETQAEAQVQLRAGCEQAAGFLYIGGAE
jgi:hypothetical protein